ncbi:MAG: ribonuclease P protein component [Bacillota bacterium]
MLSKKHKLHLNRDFDKTFKAGRSQYGRFLGLRLKKNDLDYSRFGVILGLKVDKSAVGRHRLKRRIYGIIEKNYTKLPFPADCVIIALPTLKEASFQETEDELLAMLNRLYK